METQFVDGMSVFKPHENAPDFVKLNISINREKLIAWLNQQEPNEKGYIKIDLKKSKKGVLYLALNTYTGRTEKVEDTSTISQEFKKSLDKDDEVEVKDIPF